MKKRIIFICISFLHAAQASEQKILLVDEIRNQSSCHLMVKKYFIDGFEILETYNIPSEKVWKNNDSSKKLLYSPLSSYPAKPIQYSVLKTQDDDYEYPYTCNQASGRRIRSFEIYADSCKKDSRNNPLYYPVEKFSLEYVWLENPDISIKKDLHLYFMNENYAYAYCLEYNRKATDVVLALQCVIDKNLKASYQIGVQDSV